MIDVTVANFETEVVEASMTTPVLVDFWAPWCGPCKSLGPVLEKVETAYNGRFKLVKINSDDEQELAGAFGIRSIPTCVLMVGGKPVDGFMGALPEGQVKAFLDKHLPAENELEAQAEEEEALQALDDGDVETALAKLHRAVETDPHNDEARFDLVKLLLEMGLEDEAKVAFAPVIAKAAGVRKLDSLNHWIKALDAVAHFADQASAEAEFLSKIDTTKAFKRCILQLAWPSSAGPMPWTNCSKLMATSLERRPGAQNLRGHSGHHRAAQTQSGRGPDSEAPPWPPTAAACRVWC